MATPQGKALEFHSARTQGFQGSPDCLTRLKAELRTVRGNGQTHSFGLLLAIRKNHGIVGDTFVVAAHGHRRGPQTR